MNFSGYDNVVFSNANALHVVARLARLIKARWGRLMHEGALLNELAMPCVQTHLNREFFYCRDAQMKRRHDRIGYNVEDGGEGCFLLMARTPDFSRADIRVEREYTHAPFKREPYEARLCGVGLTEFTLVTPGDPSSDPLSGFLLAAFMNMLCDGHDEGSDK